MSERRIVVAMDGPSGTGKSTAAKLLAKSLRASYLDTGAMYRVATLHVLRANIDLDDPEAIAASVSDLPLYIGTDPNAEEIRLGDEDVSDQIRNPEVTQSVSAVAAVPLVRQMLVERQREIAAKSSRVVLEGRDIGTVVLPDASIKLYLTASAEARAARRNTQNIAEGRGDDLAGVLVAVERRDHLDSTRAISPLRAAEDAVIVDTSDMTLEEVVAELVRLTEGSGND